MKQANLRDMFKKVSTDVSTSTIMVSSDLMSPIQSVSSVMKTPDNTEENPDDPESADERDTKMQYFSG
jgi:hypothetical protein